MISKFVLAEISPYPTVLKVVKAQYTETRYKVPMSLSTFPVLTTQVSGFIPSSFAEKNQKHATTCTHTSKVRKKLQSLTAPKLEVTVFEIEYILNFFDEFAVLVVLKHFEDAGDAKEAVKARKAS